MKLRGLQFNLRIKHGGRGASYSGAAGTDSRDSIQQELNNGMRHTVGAQRGEPWSLLRDEEYSEKKKDS